MELNAIEFTHEDKKDYILIIVRLQRLIDGSVAVQTWGDDPEGYYAVDLLERPATRAGLFGLLEGRQKPAEDPEMEAWEGLRRELALDSLSERATVVEAIRQLGGWTW